MKLQDIYRILDVESKAKRNYELDREEYEQCDSGDRVLKDILSSRLEKDYFEEQRQMVQRGIVLNEQTPPEILRELWEDEEFLDYSYLAENPNTPEDILNELYRRGYEKSLVKNPKLSPTMLTNIFEKYFGEIRNSESGYFVCGDIARNPNTPPEILRKLSEVDYGELKHYVARHPNTPEDILEKMADLNNIYHSTTRYGVLANPAISEEFRNKIIQSCSRDYGEKTWENPMSRSETLKLNASSILKNTNLPVEVIREIEALIPEIKYDKNYCIAHLLTNPNTPIDLIEKYSKKINYERPESGSVTSIFYSILQNPNTTDKIIETMTSGLELFDKPENDIEDRPIFYDISNILGHGNTPTHILLKYLNTDESIQRNKGIFIPILRNPKFFEFLKEIEASRSSLLKREEIQLSEQEGIAAGLAEIEKGIEQENGDNSISINE